MILASLLLSVGLPLPLCLWGIGLCGAVLHAAWPPPADAELEALLAAGLHH